MNSARWQRPGEAGWSRIRLTPASADRFCAVVVGLATAALLIPVAYKGWVPHDEGTLAQVASRILSGEWPHVDFFDVYPGLQGVIHAGAFWTLGESFSSLRTVWLGVAATASIGAYSLLKERLTRPLAAVASSSITILAFVIYPASMPTWWNISLGMSAIGLIYFGWRGSRWTLVLAGGLLTGVSILIKTTGGAFVAIAAFVWLVSIGRAPARWLAIVASMTAVLAVAVLVVPVASVGRVILIGLPAILGIAVVWLQSRHPDSELPQDGKSASLPWIYAIGAVLPPAFVMGFYLGIGKLDALIAGWVSSPALRFESAVGDIPFAPSVLLLGLLGGSIYLLKQRMRRNHTALGIGVVAALAIWGALDWTNVGRLFFGVLAWGPLLLAIGLFGHWNRLKNDRLALLVVLSALMFALVQIPLWNGYYAAFTLPLLGVGLLLLIPSGRGLTVAIIAVTAGMFLVQSISGRLVGPRALEEPVSYVDLENPRAGISVPSFDGYYDELATRVAVVAGGQPVYAGPDAPEVVFLADVEPATPSFFEVLDANWDYAVVADLAEAGHVVVVNARPDFSDPIPLEVVSRIHSVNENQEVIGKFTVTWAGGNDPES